MLKCEMDDHIGYEKHKKAKLDNLRNGNTKKVHKNKLRRIRDSSAMRQRCYIFPGIGP